MKLSEINDNINNLNNIELPDIKFNIDLLKKRNIIVVGDSYTEGYNPDGNTTPWSETFKNIVNPENMYIGYKGGSGFGFSVDGIDFLQVLKNISVPNNNKITDIIFIGGYNEQFASSNSDVENGIISCKNYCKANYPNAKLYIGCVGWSSDSNKNHKIKYEIRQSYRNAIQHGYIYLTNVEYIMQDISLFCSDDYHPTQHGEYLLGCGIAQSFLGSLSVDKPFINKIISPDNNVEFDDQIFGESMHNDEVTVLSTGFDITFKNPITISTNQGNQIKLADITGGYITGDNNGFSVININGYLYLPDNKYRNFNGWITFNHRELQLTILDINDSYDNFSNLTINRVYIHPFNYNITI